MVKRFSIGLSILLSLLTGVQCTPEKEVDLALPDYPNIPVIECYLEPGKPYRLIAYYSVDYFDSPELIDVKNAQFQILHAGQTIDLVYDTQPRTGEFKRYNYRANDLITVPHDKSPFLLKAIIDGKTYYAQTIIPEKINIESMVIECNDELRCRITTRYTDPIHEKNYYRYLSIADSIDGEIKQDFAFNDEWIENGKGGINGRLNFNKGQTGIIKLIHITKDYYDFLNTVQAAQSANGNPFAQPATVKSNIPGLIGIFTGIGEDEKSFPVVD